MYTLKKIGLYQKFRLNIILVVKVYKNIWRSMINIDGYTVYLDEIKMFRVSF